MELECDKSYTGGTGLIFGIPGKATVFLVSITCNVDKTVIMCINSSEIFWIEASWLDITVVCVFLCTGCDVFGLLLARSSCLDLCGVNVSRG